MACKFSYSIEALQKHHKKEAFRSDVHALDAYLHRQASQDMRKHVGAIFVLIDNNTSTVVGYYSLSAIGIEAKELPETIIKKLPKYPILPATLLGRLAIDKNYQGQGFGELLLIDALKRSLIISRKIASMAVIVDVKDAKAVSFYQRYGFLAFPNLSQRCFMPMATVEKLFTPANNNGSLRKV